MLKNRDVICLSSIDWDFIWQGHQEIMSSLAAAGNRVLFVENTGVRSPTFHDLPRLKKRLHNWMHSIKGLRKERENLYIYSPLILPFPYSRIARFINSYLVISALNKSIRSLGFSRPIIWTFLPTGLILDIVGAIDSSLLVYYCIDNFAASSTQAKKIVRTEKLLLEKSDLVFVTSKNLYDKCARHNNNVHLFPYGFNLEIYEKARKGEIPAPPDIVSIRHPIVGYVGGVHKWVDFTLVKYAAMENPGKSFVFVGPLQRDVSELKDLPNIYFLGKKQYQDLPAYILQFDVCIIPYLDTEYTKNVYPTKINEYLTMGKAVVSTGIPEIEAFNRRNKLIINVAKTKEEFSRLIEETAAKGVSAELYQRSVKAAAEEGIWSKKINDMSGLIEAKIADNEIKKSLHWEDNIMRLYKRSKRKIVVTASVLLLVYFILFKTPFIWMVGKPLKFSATLKKADAILVLAGGVGESGKAGQGYEERVQYAVSLYREGYAPYLIFSSGYQYAIKEAKVMRALAVSLGAPERAIILEENAANTYENIKLSSDIIRKNRWKDVILITSPYHIRRVSLVCNKISPDVHFIYAPIPYSIFYGGEKSVEQRHISAIIHEYLAIIYYKAKGYI